MNKLQEMGKKFNKASAEEEVANGEDDMGTEYNYEEESDVAEEELMKADLEYLYPDEGITEQERNRRLTVPVEIVVYNTPTVTQSSMEQFVGEQIRNMDTSTTLSDFKTVNQVGFTVIGIEAARRAMWRVNHRGSGSEAHIRQTDAGWERLRDLKMVGLPMDLGNSFEWQEAIAYEMDYHIPVLDVVIFKEKGSGSVIAKYSRDAERFETTTIKIMGAEITFSRAPFTKIEAPGDVIIEGFNQNEVASIRDDILQSVGPYNSFRTITRSSKTMGCISFVNFQDAKALVEGDVVITLRREETRRPITIVANWLKEWNSAGGRLSSNTSANSPAKGRGKNQSDSSIERRVSTMEKSSKKAEEAFAAMEFRLKKEMLEQTQLNWELIGENNAALWNAVATSLSKMNAKSLDAQTCMLELSSLIGELGSINSRIMLFEAVGVTNPSALDRLEDINREKATILEQIAAKKTELKEINSREVAMEALPPTIKPRITMSTSDQGLGCTTPNKRRLEYGAKIGGSDDNYDNNNNNNNRDGGKRGGGSPIKKAKIFKFKPDILMKSKLTADVKGKSSADIRTIMNVAWAQELLRVKKFVSKNEEGKYIPFKVHSMAEWGKILGNLVAIAEMGPATNGGQQAEAVVIDIEEYLANKEEEELLNTKIN